MSEKGKKVLNMVRQIRQLYIEIGNLMKSFEKLIKENGYDNFDKDATAIRGYSKALDMAEEWIVSLMVRNYLNKKNKNEIICINVVTDSIELPARIKEPLVLVSKIEFKDFNTRDDADPWFIYFQSDINKKELGKVYKLERNEIGFDYSTDYEFVGWTKEDTASINKLSFIAVPLLDIENEPAIKKKILNPILKNE